MYLEMDSTALKEPTPVEDVTYESFTEQAQESIAQVGGALYRARVNTYPLFKYPSLDWLKYPVPFMALLATFGGAVASLWAALCAPIAMAVIIPFYLLVVTGIAHTIRQPETIMLMITPDSRRRVYVRP